VVLHIILDLKDPIGTISALYDDVDRGDDAMCGIEGREHEVIVFPQIVGDRRLTGGESTPLR
ncbi:MAG: hypothetical protein ABI561_28420, partial [Bradyrhizobium sp.]